MGGDVGKGRRVGRGEEKEERGGEGRRRRRGEEKGGEGRRREE